MEIFREGDVILYAVSALATLVAVALSCLLVQRAKAHDFAREKFVASRKGNGSYRSNESGQDSAGNNCARHNAISTADSSMCCLVSTHQDGCLCLSASSNASICCGTVLPSQNDASGSGVLSCSCIATDVTSVPLQVPDVAFQHLMPLTEALPCTEEPQRCPFSNSQALPPPDSELPRRTCPFSAAKPSQRDQASDGYADLSVRSNEATLNGIMGEFAQPRHCPLQLKKGASIFDDALLASFCPFSTGNDCPESCADSDTNCGESSEGGHWWSPAAGAAECEDQHLTSMQRKELACKATEELARKATERPSTSAADCEEQHLTALQRKELARKATEQLSAAERAVEDAARHEQLNAILRLMQQQQAAFSNEDMECVSQQLKLYM